MKNSKRRDFSIDELQKELVMKKEELKWAMSRPRFREKMIDLTRKALNEQEDNWQKNKTPVEIVDKMISKTDIYGKTILVLFNMEIVDRLITMYKIPPEMIYFFADHYLEEMFVSKLYGVKSVSGGEELMKQDSKKGGLHPLTRRVLEMGQKNFDLTFTNPPYNSGVDLRIISAVSPICREMVIVHPSTWLIDIKGKYKPFNKFKSLVCENLRTVEFFNGNPVFNIGLFVPCVITHLDKRYKGPTHVDWFGDKYTTNNCDGITKFGKEWRTIVKPFMSKIRKYILEKGSVWDQNKLEIDKNKFHCQMAAIIGHTSKEGGMVRDDFYTMVMKNSDGNKGIRQPDLKRKNNATPTFEFDTEKELDNFIDYCKTDFARFCLALYKDGQNLSGGGAMEFVPWMCFGEEWNDKKLFKFFGIDKKTRKYIRSFIPDYYGIRNYFGSGKTGKVSIGEKSINLDFPKESAKTIGTALIVASDMEDIDNVRAFYSKENDRLTVTRDSFKKKKVR